MKSGIFRLALAMFLATLFLGGIFSPLIWPRIEYEGLSLEQKVAFKVYENKCETLTVGDFIVLADGETYLVGALDPLHGGFSVIGPGPDSNEKQDIQALSYRGEGSTTDFLKTVMIIARKDPDWKEIAAWYWLE